ncbi:nuclear transport factor 2 family protein [Arachnia propionica]|uniref:Nuclear transport factor 2 family protein n=1 Tax=Arachnia propionica TaxID=1750 RepID=A0A3P1T356_9ACTN|nr:nuclear transport factor 2 family protein [Arachnia propionica]RRD03728.1 nuclear transport factor 2 family protein [Arachnia propionica]
MTMQRKTTQFADEYLRTWTEPDQQHRNALIEQIWAPDGVMSVSSLGITITGVADIAAHITRVHDDMIAGKGLRFVYDQEVASGDATLLRWSMLTPQGEVAGRGVDVVFRDTDGKVTAVHMFMGID